MLKLIGWRVAGMLPLLVLISLLVSLLTVLVPGDPALAILGDNATPEAAEALRQQLGLGDPFFVRYGRWIWNALHGDLGRALFGGQPVTQAIVSRAGVTVSLVLAAIVIQTVVALTLGIASGFRPGSLVDRVSNSVMSVAVAIPAFWLGLLLTLVVAQQLGWLPAIGYVSPLEDPVEGAKHLLLPAISLAAPGTAELYRQTRASVVDVTGQDYIRTAQAAGLSNAVIARKHVAKNAMIPVVTVLGLQLGRMIGISAVIEAVFGMQGIGSLAVNAALNGDLPVIQGVVLVTASVVLLLNLGVDVSYRYFNPRLRVR